MARPKNLANMSYAELAATKAHVESLMTEKQLAEKAALKQKLADLAEKGGFSLDELLGKARKATGKVAIKYRDPKNPANTWTGRGRMPRWMTAATKGSKDKKEDFLIS